MLQILLHSYPGNKPPSPEPSNKGQFSPAKQERIALRAALHLSDTCHSQGGLCGPFVPKLPEAMETSQCSTLY